MTEFISKKCRIAETTTSVETVLKETTLLDTTKLDAKLDANGIDYYSTTRGDDSVLEWSSKTRRPCVITYWPAHAVLFCGYTVHNGKAYAAILDNNRISNLIFVDKQVFLSNWKTKYWGCATVILNKPTPMLPSWNQKEDS